MRVRRGYVMVELLLVVTWAFAVLTLVLKGVTDGMYLVRLAAQHESRSGVVDSLSRALQADLLLASRCSWDSGVLQLESAAPAVHYEFTEHGVTRSANGVVSHEWRADRLTFAAGFTPGPRADLLTVEFGEAPPPRAVGLPRRATRTAFVLPRSAAASASRPAEESP